MDSSDTKPSDAEWKESRRGQAEPPTPLEDDDDLMLQALGVCDGFRPATTPATPISDRTPRSSYSTQEETRPPTANWTVSPPSRSSSMRKSPLPEDSSIVEHDLRSQGLTPSHGSRSSYMLSRQPSSATSISTTSSAFTDVAPAIVREQPYQGPSGPSHPYTMYRQDIGLSRTMSVTTTSTVEPSVEQPYMGPTGPGFAYGSYTQDVSGMEQNTVAQGTRGVIVGFSGPATDNYRRRIGPDGEEIGGMIGPHGHTEELPPYTRYPDEQQYDQKIEDSEALPAATAPSASRPTSLGLSRQQDTGAQSILPISGAGGMGIAARNPEFDSVDDLTSPQTRQSSRSYVSTSDLSHHEINTAAAAIVSEKAKPVKRWQKAGRRRLYGVIPYWAVLLALTGLLITGIVLGAVIGAYVVKRDKGPAGGGPPPGPPTVYDAVPIPIPSGLPDLPEGKFGMPVVIKEQPNICFNDTAQAPAWSCNIIFGFGAAMTIEVKKQSNDFSISIGANQSLTIKNGLYAYGTQPQVLEGTHTLQTVTDLLEPSRGPAWFKMLSFNKTVIVPENMLFATTFNSPNKRRRQTLSPPTFGPNDFRRRFAAQPGDKPWICTWPDTLLEIFIYPNQNTNPSRMGERASSIIAAATTQATPSITRGAPFLLPTGTQAPTGVFSDIFGATERFTAPTAGATPSNLPGEAGIDLAALQPGYPRVVKLEERRVQRAPRPVCRQVLIGNDGTATPVVSSSGKPVEITIIEQGNSPPLAKRDEADVDVGADPPQLLKRDAAAISDCGCVWFLT